MSKLRKYKSAIIRKLLSPSLRFEITQTLAWIREQLNLACLWRWEIATLPQRDDSPYNLLYVGRKAHRELARILLGIENFTDNGHADGNRSGRRVFISEMPTPGALCVPQYLRAIVPLGRTIEEIISGYDSELRRSLRKYRPRYRMQQALSDAEIDHADREMLRPYATARHGSSANQKSSNEVRRCALEFGRLDLVLSGDEVVACLLGIEHIRKGKRYWMIDRYGYPEAVFSDPKRLRETNSVNNHMALEWAITNGYDYYDIGLCFGRPDDGLIQWKRRRGAVLDRTGLRGYGHFHVQLPREGAAQFLWDTPLFAVERKKLTLHLGLPEGTSDDEFVSRYRQMGFGGLSKIYLHSTRQPDEQLLTTLCGFYKQQNPPPMVETIISS
ncbi:MAG: hypothetical protein WAW02_00855 [Sideroxyarcus sp.]